MEETINISQIYAKEIYRQPHKVRTLAEWFARHVWISVAAFMKNDVMYSYLDRNSK